MYFAAGTPVEKTNLASARPLRNVAKPSTYLARATPKLVSLPVSISNFLFGPVATFS